MIEAKVRAKRGETALLDNWRVIDEYIVVALIGLLKKVLANMFGLLP